VALNNQRTISEMGQISDEVYDNDPSGIKYFKENPQEMLIETAFVELRGHNTNKSTTFS
jgi:hypothetical protein